MSFIGTNDKNFHLITYCKHGFAWPQWKNVLCMQYLLYGGVSVGIGSHKS